MGPVPAGARGRDAAVSATTRQGVAVAETAGVRGVEEPSREAHGSVAVTSRKSYLVRKMTGRSRFLPSSSDVGNTLHELTVLWHGHLMQRVFSPRSRPSEAREV